MVLEARENADSIGFPVVGEEEKFASNVIDYNIRQEQTKDAFNVENANNQTTTGMANIIPGVNAPKLMAKTSIIGGLGGGGGGALEGDTTISLSTNVAVGPGVNGNFNTSSISSGGDGRSISGYTATPLPGGYYMRWTVQTNNLYRYIDMLGLTVVRNGTPITVWNEGNGQMIYSGATAFVFEEGDDLRLTYRYTGGSSNADTNGTIDFIRFR